LKTNLCLILPGDTCATKPNQAYGKPFNFIAVMHLISLKYSSCLRRNFRTGCRQWWSFWSATDRRRWTFI